MGPGTRQFAIRSGWAAKGSPAATRPANAGDGIPMAPFMDDDSREDRQQTEVDDPLEGVVRTKMVEGCDAVAATERDRGQARSQGMAGI
jgi:hypothetical protein